MTVDISFVIPALNEERNIQNTIGAIHIAAKQAGLNYEVIVVDHGSIDQTRGLACESGANVLSHPRGTIGELRNVGATVASGDVLVFVDADVTLTSSWATNIGGALPEIRAEHLLTGSHCSPPDNSNNVFLKHWFSSFALDPRNTHLGTGHMIVSRKNFQALGGFNVELRTGEDYEFCERATKHGFKIENKPALKVIHPDFPQSIEAFVKREAWHGKGDVATLRAMLRSKVVLATVVFLFAHGLLIYSALRIWGWGALAATILLAGLLLLSSTAKNKHSPLATVLINAGIFYFYYVGRSLALVKRSLRLFGKK